MEEDYEDFYYDTEDYLLEMWANCDFDIKDERYKNCYECDKYDECVENAQDNKDGYESFCDIISDAYGSVDAFWECNGI